MSKAKKPSSHLVYSTATGRLCPQCQRPVAECVCGSNRPAYVGDGIIRLGRETKGRGGKAVTTITGLPLIEKELKALAKQLKKRCGVGGSVKAGVIEIQGDQRNIIASELDKRGYRVKFTGA